MGVLGFALTKLDKTWLGLSWKLGKLAIRLIETGGALLGPAGVWTTKLTSTHALRVCLS